MLRAALFTSVEGRRAFQYRCDVPRTKSLTTEQRDYVIKLYERLCELRPWYDTNIAGWRKNLRAAADQAFATAERNGAMWEQGLFPPWVETPDDESLFRASAPPPAREVGEIHDSEYMRRAEFGDPNSVKALPTHLRDATNELVCCLLETARLAQRMEKATEELRVLAGVNDRGGRKLDADVVLAAIAKRAKVQVSSVEQALNDHYDRSSDLGNLSKKLRRQGISKK